MKSSCQLGFVIPVMFALFLYSCKDDIEAIPFEEVSSVLALDNGNQGNGSDLEVNFTKQFNPEEVSTYQIYVIKEAQLAIYDLSTIASLGSETYTTVAPEDIFPVQGKTLTAQTRDTDGDLIVEDQAYYVAVLTVPNDQEMWKASVAYSEYALTLTHNNQVEIFSSELDAGSGSLAINNEGTIVMAPYDIITELSRDTETTFELFSFSNSGSASVLGHDFALLGGNAFNAQGELFQAVKSTGEIWKMNGKGEKLPFTLSGATIRKPDGLYMDDGGVLFATDYQLGNVLKINADGDTELFAKVGSSPRGITGDEQGNLYVSLNEEEGRILKINSTGEVSEFARIPTFVPENYLLDFIMWVGYITYFEEHLYVAGLSKHQIFKIDMTGTVEVFAGSGVKLIPRGGAKTANFNRPMGLAFSEDGGSLFVSGCLDVVPQHTQASRPSRIYEIKLVE